MFGYIKPDVPDLRVREHELYKAVYCGLCRAQRKTTGLLSSLFLSYDFVFLYLLRAELTHTPTTFHARRISFFHRDMHNVADRNGELDYCARAAALLNYYKVKDDLKDEGAGKRAAARLLLPIVSHARKKAKKNASLPEEQLSSYLKIQDEIEKEKNAGPDRAAEMSGAIFALFSSFGIKDDMLAFASERIGKSIGCWLYLTDAADDLEKDRKKKRFNPFSDKEPDKNDLLCALDDHCESAEMMLRRIPAYDNGYRALLYNILMRGLHNTAEKAIFHKEQKQKNG